MFRLGSCFNCECWGFFNCDCWLLDWSSFFNNCYLSFLNDCGWHFNWCFDDWSSLDYLFFDCWLCDYCFGYYFNCCFWLSCN